MSLGPMELIVILGLALLVFGPSRLPGLGKALGDSIRGFKKGLSDDSEDEPKAQAKREQLTSSEASSEVKTQKVEKEKA